jgi:hypothetical protein
LPTLNQTFAAMADEAGGPGVPISERRSPIMASSGDPERDEKRLFLPHRMP